MSIGIICAEQTEMLAVKDLMKNIEVTEIFGLEFLEGKIHSKEVVLVEAGVGKVNAARTTQILIDNFEIDYVINTGSAGSLKEESNVEDIIIGERLVQYDFDITLVGDYEKGEICGIGKYFESDKKLINLCKESIDELNDKHYNVKIGDIGTADYFSGDKDRAKEILNEFGFDCVEMEGAAIAQVCKLDKVPFLVIRGISDTPNGNNKMDFHTYLKFAAKNAAEILDRLIQKI